MYTCVKKYCLFLQILELLTLLNMGTNQQQYLILFIFATKSF